MQDFVERFCAGDVLRHFKRDKHGAGTDYLYLYLGIAQHTEDNQPLVIYRALYGDGRLYARPAAMFFGPVDKQKHPEAVQDLRFDHASQEELALVRSALC